MSDRQEEPEEDDGIPHLIIILAVLVLMFSCCSGYDCTLVMKPRIAPSHHQSTRHGSTAR